GRISTESSMTADEAPSVSGHRVGTPGAIGFPVQVCRWVQPDRGWSNTSTTGQIHATRGSSSPYQVRVIMQAPRRPRLPERGLAAEVAVTDHLGDRLDVVVHLRKHVLDREAGLDLEPDLLVEVDALAAHDHALLVGPPDDDLVAAAEQVVGVGQA